MSFRLFEIFGDITLRGADAAERGVEAVSNKATTASDRLNTFGRRTSAAGSALTKWVSGPIAGATTALGALAMNTAQTGEAIRDSAREAGLSAVAYQELGFSLAQIGVDSATTDRALGRLNQRVGRAADGNDKYTKALRALGIPLEDIQSGTINTEQAFVALNARLQEAETDAEAAAIAGDLLGTRVGREMGPALRQAGGDVDALRARAQELGLVMGEDAVNASITFQDNLDELQQSFGSLWREIGEELLPIISNQLIPFLLEDGIPALRTVTQAVASAVEWFSGLPPEVQGTIGVVTALVAAIGPVLAILGKLALLLSPAGAVVVAIGATVAAIVWLHENWEEVTAFIGQTIDQIIGWFENMGARIKESIKDMVEGALGWFGNLSRRLVGNSIVPDMVDSVLVHTDRMAGRMISDMQRGAQGSADAMDKGSSDVLGITSGLVSEMESAFSPVADMFPDALQTSFASAKELLPGMTRDLTTNLLDGLGFNVSGAGGGGGLGGGGDDEAGTGETIGAIAGTAIGTYFGGAIGGAFGSVVGGVFGDALSSISPFAKGGIVTQPTLGLLGEMPDARPEVIAPLDHLQDLLDTSGSGGMVVNLTQHINGARPGEVRRETERALGRVAAEWHRR